MDIIAGELAALGVPLVLDKSRLVVDIDSSVLRLAHRDGLATRFRVVLDQLFGRKQGPIAVPIYRRGRGLDLGVAEVGD